MTIILTSSTRNNQLLQPVSNQNTAMVVEDAAVFGALFSRLRRWDQVPSLMEAYQDIRQARTEFVAAQDLTTANMCWIAPGPDRDARNEAMRRNMNQGREAWDDKMLQDQWDSFSEVFGYDALDAAADWWVGWGMLGEMAKRRTRDRMEISVKIEARAQGKQSTPVKHHDADA
jgi:salicylate hydroxylase